MLLHNSRLLVMPDWFDTVILRGQAFVCPLQAFPKPVASYPAP